MANRNRNNDGGSPSLRLLRVSENLRHAISEVLMRGDIRDPLLQSSSVTVTEVRCSPDLRHAVVYVMPLGGSDQEAIIVALGEASKYIRGQIAKKVRMKYMPRLDFRIDESYDEAGHITELLNDPKVRRDLDSEDEFSGRLILDDDE